MKYIKKRHIFINENIDDYHIDEYVTQYGSNLIEDPEEGRYYSQNKKDVSFGPDDIDNKNRGELVPDLCSDFNASIEANDCNLISLKQFPSNIVRGSLSIHDNLLTSLEYCPTEIEGNFMCDSNNITSLEGCPNQVDGYVELSNNKLKTLKGIESLICDEIFFNGNIELISTEGLSNVECYVLYLNGCINLKDIIELPGNIENLEINNTNIKSMKTFYDNKLSVDNIYSDIINDFEKEFFYDFLDIYSKEKYEQLLVDHIIKCINNEYEQYEDLEISEILNDLHLDFSSCNIEKKYKNIFLSSNAINKFKL